MKAAIEAVLFTMGGSVEAGRLAAALEIDDAQLYALMVEMMEDTMRRRGESALYSLKTDISCVPRRNTMRS
jgi:chromosome segregation and condensation protein ScpB